MIRKVSAKGKILLHPALAGCIFNVKKQADGGLVLKWKGRRIGGRMIRDAATRALLRKLGQQPNAASPSTLAATA